MTDPERKSCVCVAVVSVALLVISGLPLVSQGDGLRGGPVMLKVGELDHMKSRNTLPYIADDIWTHDVLDRVYDTVGKSMPETEELRPYILKGVDADENGQFDANEYGRFAKNAGKDPLTVTAYYDFNGVYFHDGVQADEGDLFFSYQMRAMNPRMNDHVRVLMDNAGKSGSNYSTTRWLFISPVAKVWQNEPTAGNASLRYAVRFQLQEPFFLFYRSTLGNCVLYPRHVWEGTGWRLDPVTGNPITPLHADFGSAIYPESDSRFGRGVPTTETTYRPFVYLNTSTPEPDSAEEWQPTDDEVIGTGPFTFESFDEMQAVATVLKNSIYFTGRDWKAGVVIDPLVAVYIHQPFIDGIVFLVFPNVILGVLALRSGQIDFLHASIPPEFIPELISNPNIRLWFSPDPGFTYLAYNMRRPSIGTWHWGQADQFDIGYHFRQAVAHLIDKPTIVKNFLQGYGVPGVVPVSPFNTRFHNNSIVGYDFSRTKAENELALAHQDALWLASGGEPAAANWYTKDPGTGKYILPNIGTNQFILWCPNADYDPVKANSCTMIATEMQYIGINVVARPSALSAITSLMNAHDFDMYILDWRIRTKDPDYLNSFFHSSNSASGKNYPGFNDVLSDLVLEESRMEMNESDRIGLLKWEQGIIADKLPYDTMYFRTNIEAERQDRFVGWNQSLGTIWNEWSLLNIRPPSAVKLSVSIDAPSAVASGSSTAFAVVVKDQDGVPITGATVTLRLLPDTLGNFTYGGSPPSNTYTGITSLGRLAVTYLAPEVTNIINVTVTATAAYVDYPEGSDSAIVTVYPAGVNFLAVTVSVLDMDVLPPSGTTRLAIGVTDPQGFTKDDADVAVYVDQPIDPPYGVWPSQGKAAQMVQVTFHAPLRFTLPYDENPFIVTAEATSPGYYPGQSSVGLKVVKTYNPPTASFTVSPASGSAATFFTFNASASSDLEDPATALEVRWNWENDSTWDTPWSTNKEGRHQFTRPGTYTVRLEVRDSDLMVGNTTRQVVVSAGTDTDGFPWIVVIPVMLVAVVLAILAVFLLRRKKKPEQRQGP